MSDEPPQFRIVSRNDGPEFDMRGLRMWAVETALMIVSPGPKALDRVRSTAERLIRYVLEGERNDA